MSRSPNHMDADIAEFLVLGGRVVAAPAAAHVPEPTPHATRRPRRLPPHPAMAKETRLEVPDGSGHPFTVVLRPARVRTTYLNGSGMKMATLAKRTEEQWLVSTKSGRYLGILQEGGGREPWGVAQLASETTAIGESGVRVRSHILTAATWRDAIAEGALVWWAPDGRRS
jgi:hypothetical protein